jgi:hypothetical protein
MSLRAHLKFPRILILTLLEQVNCQCRFGSARKGLDELVLRILFSAILLRVQNRYLESKDVPVLNYHTSNMYSVLNYAPRHEDVWVSGSVAPSIINLGTRWM